MKPMAVILMGVSGSGKTAVGKALAQELGWPFYDGDDYHPRANVKKMAAGIPLSGEDRRPWLEQLHDLIIKTLTSDVSVILACSALKQSYRDFLQGGRDDVVIVYLKGSFELVYERMLARSGHYFKPEMLASQFEALEEPERAVVIDIAHPLNEIVKAILLAIGRMYS